MRFAVLLVSAALIPLCGCNGDGDVKPYRDFPVIATAEAGEVTVYLGEVRRLGKRVFLVFRFEETEKAVFRSSIVCSEITGGADSEFERIAKDGWVELRCETDYPIEAKKLEFVLRMCEEPACEKMDVALRTQVPALGEVGRPAVSERAEEVEFSVEMLACLKGDPDIRLDARPGDGAIMFPYGNKNLVLGRGDENVIVVVCKARFPGAIPDVPRGYSEWDQVIVADNAGTVLGGAKSTSDVGNERYYALVSVGREKIPGEINVCFSSVSTLASLRREFAFSDLRNPR